MLGIALGRPVFEAVNASTEEPAATAIAERVSVAIKAEAAGEAFVAITTAEVAIVELATWLALSAAFVCFAGALAVEELCSTANHPGTAPSMEAFPASFWMTPLRTPEY